MPDDGVTVNVDGLDLLAGAMDQLPLRVGRAASRTALRAGERVFESALLSTVPRDKGGLANSIGSKIHVRADLSEMGVIIGPKYEGGHKQTTQDPGVYGLFQERGTRKFPPKYWVSRAYEVAKGPAVDAVVAVLRAIIDSIPKG